MTKEDVKICKGMADAGSGMWSVERVKLSIRARRDQGCNCQGVSLVLPLKLFKLPSASEAPKPVGQWTTPAEGARHLRAVECSLQGRYLHRQEVPLRRAECRQCSSCSRQGSDSPGPEKALLCAKTTLMY